MNSLWQTSTFCVALLDTLNLSRLEKSITDLTEVLSAFKVKLMIFTTDLMATQMLHFPQLRAAMSTAPGAHTTTDNNDRLRDKIDCELY